jgi:hypothetical protein
MRLIRDLDYLPSGGRPLLPGRGRRQSLRGWRDSTLGHRTLEPASSEGIRGRSSGVKPILYQPAIRLTVNPVPAIFGRPPRIAGSRSIRVPISMMVPINLIYAALLVLPRTEHPGERSSTWPCGPSKVMKTWFVSMRVGAGTPACRIGACADTWRRFHHSFVAFSPRLQESGNS